MIDSQNKNTKAQKSELGELGELNQLSEFNAQNKPWSGRFSKPNNQFVQSFSASIDIDQKMAAFDIKGSIAHANMLAKIGVLNSTEQKQIVNGLKTIEKQIKKNNFVWREDLEDVHMNIESALIDLIGGVGKKLHTARSRNDQVATDLRLYLRFHHQQIKHSLIELIHLICKLANQHIDVIMPGFTHLQPAQPITFAHHLMAWVEMLIRDVERFDEMYKRINTLPLGSAALAGSPYPIDRQMVADELGFERLSENSLDAVSDRDFCIEFVSASSTVMMHYSRMCEEMILWNSIQFNFIEFDDSYCTGSSIMPQKKNPDIAELVRGKSAQVYGNLMALLTLMKSQPLAYNRDNQEDKRFVFDSVDTLSNSTLAMIGLISHLKANIQSMRKSAELGYINATDLADYLVGLDIPFRDAHRFVGLAVKKAIEKNCSLQQLELTELQKICPKIKQEVYSHLDLENSIAKRTHLGGTAPKTVKKAIASAQNRINAFRTKK